MSWLVFRYVYAIHVAWPWMEMVAGRERRVICVYVLVLLVAGGNGAQDSSHLPHEGACR